MDSITISDNYWRVPSERHAFDGWLEGAPTEEERRQTIADAVAARAAWKPSAEGMELVEQLKAFIGCRVRLQFWDSCMWLLEEEAPYPTEVDCHGVTLLLEDGFLQAFLEVSHPKEFPTKDGYSPMSYFKERPDCKYLLASFANLYMVTKVVSA